MRAVLMAGGAGTRLRPLTCDLPKPMVSIFNRPIAEHIIRLLRQNGIEEIITTLHYLPDVLRDYFQDGSEFGVRMIYAVEADQPLGTAGCVKNIEELLRSTFLVISGDSVTDFDLRQAIAFHRTRASKATIVLTRVPNPLEFGVVITNEQGQIQRFLEKPSTSEVFSDTVNTGIYILEPEVLAYLPDQTAADFSQDLFPLLLDKGVPMYGYVASGYWCDVGNLETYRQAQYDQLPNYQPNAMGYTEYAPGIWVGPETIIDPSSTIAAPTLIGSQCRIGPRVRIEGGTIIGDHVTVGADADLQRPIIWSGCNIGEEAHLSGCIVARGVNVDRRVQLLEGSVIGPTCNIGEEAKVNSHVRVWPHKHIEAGAILNSNLIWGYTAHRNLFGQRGVAGLANVEIIPEFAVKLGAAYGSTLQSGMQVTVSRDQRPVSRMVSRSIIAGLMSVGIHVQDLKSTAIPVARSVLPVLDVAGGIHVRVDPRRSKQILIEFFDRKGINISKAAEKKIEGAFFKEDFRRATVPEIGNIVEVNQAIDIYNRGFAAQISGMALQDSNTKVVIDYAYAVAGAVLPQLLARFGCDAVVLNASLSHTAPTTQTRETLLDELGRVVIALKANFGVQVAANGELLTLVDETGDIIRGEDLTALMTDVMLSTHPGSTVVVPVQSSQAIELIAANYNGKVIRTKNNPTALMEACYNNPHTILGGSGEMGFIFPQLHPGFDAMFCIAKLIELLQTQRRTLGEIRSNCPTIAHHRIHIRCPWKVKGALMRHMVETHVNQRIELIDGVKIFNDRHDSWVLVLPDASEPLIHIYANSADADWVHQTLDRFEQDVQAFSTAQQAAINRTSA